MIVKQSDGDIIVGLSAVELIAGDGDAARSSSRAKEIVPVEVRWLAARAGRSSDLRRSAGRAKAKHGEEGCNPAQFIPSG